MNILYLSLLDFSSLLQRGIYTDLLREFAARGHKIYAVSPTEKDSGHKVGLLKEDGAQILKIHVGDLQKSANYVKKGVSTVALGYLLTKNIKRQFKDIRFDLVLYPTPPVTIYNAVRYIKKRDSAVTYLMLKDIFPQGAVDMGALSKRGITAPAYFYFRRLEKKLYFVSDRIGCMSDANVAYIRTHEPWLRPNILEVCPNSVEIIDKSVDAGARSAIRARYSIPDDKTVFIYGGNLGRPQGIPHLLKCVESQKNNEKAYFLIVGDGTDYHLLEEYIEQAGQENIKLLRSIPKDEYDTLVSACDVGLIFLDHRYTVPNFPSRILSYMQAKIPVLACTDPVTDVGKVLVNGGFGWWCESDNVAAFSETVYQCLAADRAEMGQKGFAYLKAHYSAADACRIILNSMQHEEMVAEV